MDKLERLLNLTGALLTAPRPLTVAEIAERVPGYPEEKVAFRRAFERDKDALRAMGIPLVRREILGVEPTTEGYSIPRDQYELADPGLAPDELAALHLATVAVQLEGLAGTEAIWKLGGATAEGPPRAAVAALPTIPALVPLFDAVVARRHVRFGYRGGERRVDPWRVSYANGHWYLDGWDHDRAAERQFRLDRLEGEVVAGEAHAFAPPPAPASGGRPWELGPGSPVRARLRVDADQAGWAVDHLGAEAVVARDDDGAVEVELDVTNHDAFRSFVLGFLDHAEVVSPVELRDELTDWLRALAA